MIVLRSISPVEVDRLMKEYISGGWDYDEDYSGERLAELCVKTPAGRWVTIDYCLSQFDDGLKIGDEEQIDAKNAIKFYEILFNFGYLNLLGLEWKVYFCE